MIKKNNRRKKYFLPNTSQARILFTVQVILAVIGLIASAVLYILLNRDLTESFFSAHITLENVRELLFPSLLIVNIVLLLMSGVINIFFSHRIAGPAYRLSVAFKKIAVGDWTYKVFLRKGDFLKELARDYNRAVDDTVDRLKVVQDAYSELEKTVGEDLQAKQALDDLKAALDAFVTAKEEKHR